MKYKISSGFDMEDRAGNKKSCSAYLVLSDDGVGEKILLNMLDNAVRGFKGFVEENSMDSFDNMDNMDSMDKVEWQDEETTDSLFGDEEGWFK